MRPNEIANTNRIKLMRNVLSQMDEWSFPENCVSTIAMASRSSANTVGMMETLRIVCGCTVTFYQQKHTRQEVAAKIEEAIAHLSNPPTKKKTGAAPKPLDTANAVKARAKYKENGKK